MAKKTCRHPRRKPYGTKGTENYCRPHDQCRVYSVSKKAERAKVRRDIKKSLKDNQE